MLFDSHSHTEFSSDSEMKATDAIARTAELGIGLVFTEHYDYDYRTCLNYSDKDFLFDAKEYWKKYSPLRSDSLHLGVEVGMTEANVEPNKKFIAQVPFDQVIGSVHALDNHDIYYPDFYEGKTKVEAYSQYLDTMREMVNANSYIDVLGHIDYISRYAPFDDREIQYEIFHDKIDSVLQAVLNNDIVMEVNTRRLADKRAQQALVPIYTRYRELGGRYVTLGSDGHNTGALGMNFDIAKAMVDAIGLQVVSFSERQMFICES